MRKPGFTGTTRMAGDYFDRHAQLWTTRTDYYGYYDRSAKLFFMRGIAACHEGRFKFGCPHHTKIVTPAATDDG
jgi:hypothetical protein